MGDSRAVGSEEQAQDRRRAKGVLRTVLLGVCALAVAGIGAAAAFGALSRSTVAPTTVTVNGGAAIGLHGVVGPGFTISFTYSDTGTNVTQLNPGTYKVQIDDLANNHDFHLTGNGTDLSTDVAAIGTSQWTVNFQPGSYMFVCDPHAATMNGQLSVLPYSTVTSFPAPVTVPKTTVTAHKKHR
jgi:plastocyanin